MGNDGALQSHHGTALCHCLLHLGGDIQITIHKDVYKRQGLYLVTHADDQEVLNLSWKYIALAKEGRARYQEQYGPLTQTTVTEGGYRWLKMCIRDSHCAARPTRSRR